MVDHSTSQLLSVIRRLGDVLWGPLAVAIMCGLAIDSSITIDPRPPVVYTMFYSESKCYPEPPCKPSPSEPESTA